MNQTLLVIAGEDSGDLHGAELLRELKARRPDLRIIGVGGPRMTPLLDRKLADVKDLAVGLAKQVQHRGFGTSFETQREFHAPPGGGLQ